MLRRSRSTSMLCVTVLLFAAATIPSTARAQHTTAAAVQNFVPSPRAMGMGNAFTAIADDGWAVWWNPGALSLMDQACAGLYSSAKPWGRPYDFKLRTAAVAGGHDGIGFGAHYARLGYGESTATDDSGLEIGTFESYDDAFHLAGSVDLIRVLGRRPAPVSLGVGASLKRIHTFLAPGFATPDHKDAEGSAYDVDLGLLCQGRTPLRVGDRDLGAFDVSAGWVQRNLFDAEISYRDHNNGDPIGSFSRVGFAAHVSLGSYRVFPALLDITAAIDQTGPLHRYGGGAIKNRGLEVGLLHFVYLRTGKIEDKRGDVVGTTSGWGVGPELRIAGGDRTARLRLDYAKVPQADPLPKLEQYSLSFGVGL